MTATQAAGLDLGPLEAIPVGEGRTFRVGDEDIAVFRLRDGTVRAVQAHCPHRGGPLADGLVGEGKVVCPLHGYAFELDSGKALRADCEHVRVWTVTVDGEGRLRLDPGPVEVSPSA
jgi:nitrite reductase (NADH) small subunit